MFDGQFRSKPIVTHRGSSHVGAAAEDVIAENRKRRETRLAQRKEEDAALTIQRIIRGALSRSHVKQSSRAKFDNIIKHHDRVQCTRLLCNFYDPRLDHDRLTALFEVLEKQWSEFSAPSNSYPRVLILTKCIEDAHHQLIVLSLQNFSSLQFTQKIVQDKSFSADRLLELTTLDNIVRSYAKLIQLIDRTKEGSGCFVQLIRNLNVKYYELILKHVVLNDKLTNGKLLVDRVFSSKVSSELCNSILGSIDIRLVCRKLDENFNHYLDIIVHFFGRLVPDVHSSNKMLDVLFKILNRYRIPEVVEISRDESSDSEEDEMLVDKLIYNLDCLDPLFQKCANTSSNLNISCIAYLLIVKFNMSVIQTPPIRWLCFNSSFMKWLWHHLSTREVSGVFNTGPPLCLAKMSENRPLSNSEYQEFIPPLTVFCCLFYEYLRSSHDADILEGSTMLFTVTELKNLCKICRDLSVNLTSLDLIAIQPHKTVNIRSAFTSRHIAIPGSLAELESRLVLAARDWVTCWSAVTRLTSELHKRDSRLEFTDSRSEWLSKSKIHNINRDNVGVFIDPMSVPNLSLNTIKELYLLHSVPFIVPFGERVSIFHDILEEDAQQVRGGHAGWSQPGSSNTIKASIRREYIYEDAYAQLTESVAPNMKNRIMVQLINYSGLDEAGVDGGGLFREFLASFLKEAFNPNRGFFIETDGRLHPNPAAQHLYPDYQKHYFFIGRLLGKAVYEKLLVDIPLASYFLEKLLGGDADINHLRSLDLNMYRNILSLRGYSDDTIAELCLYFIVSDNMLGETKTIELKPNGSAIQVTRSNLIEYIHLMADYRLNRQIRIPFRNFAEGFYSVVPPEWLKMFSYSEFQSLLSGSETDIDIADLKENTVYQGNYSAQHPTIVMFWDIVETMSPEEHRKLLAFVTSTDRTPLLGFKSLLPLFAIHSAGAEDRLPTASTCMNLLKLPEFSDKNIMEKRVRYVIEAGAGFELS